MRPLLTTRSSFAADTVDKVERLLEVLATLRDDPLLGSAFVLHGGTALNVFAEDLRRLSVDIDLMYVGEVDVDAMRTERPRVDARIREITMKLGYVVQGADDEHSGHTCRLKYDNTYIKIDVSYLARVALLDPVHVACPICSPPVEYGVLDRRELLAGKVKALMERVASRDLYDLDRAASSTPDLFGDPMARALVIRAISASDPFPSAIDPVTSLARFSDPGVELVESLRVVVASDEEASIPQMCARVGDFLAPCAVLSDDEAEYIRQLDEESMYLPELLFSAWPEALERAKLDPVMQWKVQNLRKRVKAV